MFRVFSRKVCMHTVGTKIIILFWTIPLLGQVKNNQDHHFVAFYNTENLFDTIDSPFTNDYEFLPKSSKKWDTEKYHQKLHHIARVISSMNNWEGPDVIGLCEVENLSLIHI